MQWKNLCANSFKANTDLYNIPISKVIKYKQMYLQPNSNNYSALEDFKKCYGIYFFVNESGEVIYVGEAHSQVLKDRIIQHFNESSGGLRSNLRNNQFALNELYESTVFVFVINSDDRTRCRDIRFAESYYIGRYRLKYNFNK